LGKVNLNGNLLVSFYSIYGENLPFKYSGWDQLRIYFPFYKVTFEAFRNFSWPLWNPYAFSGHPHAADFQSAVFYPLNIFGLFIAQIEFWHLLRITPTILASFFTFVYLKSLKISNLAAFFGAVTFGFSPFILTWGEEVVMSVHSVLWLPLILWGIEKYIESGKSKFLALISLAGAFSLLAGYMQTTIYVFVFAFLYSYVRLGIKNLQKPKHLLIFAALFFSGFLAAVQILPSAELFFNSARSQVTLRETLFEFLLPVETLITFLAPDFFGNPGTANFFRMGVAQYYEGILFAGIGALIFAAHAVFSRGRENLVKFLVLFGLFSLSTTLDLPSSKLFLSLPIPFLSTSIANRVLFISAFCIATLAALGVDSWLRSKDKKILTVVFGFLAVYALLSATVFVFKQTGWNYFEHAKFYSENNVLISLRNLVIPIGVFGASGLLIAAGTLRPNIRRICMLLILTLALLNIFYFAKKYFSFSERQYVFLKSGAIEYVLENQGLYRSWSAGRAFLENNFATQYGLFWPEGYDSLNNKSYGEFSFAMQGDDINKYIFRADAGFGRGEAWTLLDNPGRRKLLNLTGVKYVITKGEDGEIFKKNNFAEVFRDSDWVVFENLEVMPRAFLASNYEGPPDIFGEDPKTAAEKAEREKLRRKLIPQKLLSQDFDLRNVLILEKPAPISAQFGQGTAEITKYEPLEVVVETKSDQPKLLFLSDNFYPGWKATVDGDDTPVMRANYTFRAVPLTPGEHEVRFYFDPWTFKFGIIVSALSFAMLLLYLRGRRF
jgi:hypothetical protein